MVGVDCTANSRTARESAELPRAHLKAIPAIHSPYSPAELFARLDRLAVNGKLPGYEPIDEATFRVTLFGNPFDRRLIASIKSGASAPEAGGCACQGSTIEFRTSLRSKAPVVLIVSVLVSIWPGVRLMDALIPARWGWWPTWMWYLPLVIVPLPIFTIRLWRKSQLAAEDHLREQYERIAAAVQ